MATQLFKVTSRDGVNIRTAPRTNAAKATTMGLVLDDILEVVTESRTVADNFEWWEHAQSPGWWSVAKQINPEKVFMTPYQLPLDPAAAVPPVTVTQPATPIQPVAVTQPATVPTKLLEVVTNVLKIRSQPQLGNTLVAGQALKRGERLHFFHPTKADGFLWWEQAQHPGWWSASGSLQGGQTFMEYVPDPIPDDEQTRLDVPWITQIQAPKNLANDCGHACVLMVMRYFGFGADTIVADLYSMPHKNSNGTTNQNHLQLIARDATQSQLQLTTFSLGQASATNFQTLQDKLKADRPVTLLVWYPSLQFNNPSSGSFNHWITLTGFSGNTIYVNDPLWTTENAGAGRTIDRDRLLTACAKTNMGLYGVY